MNPWIFWTPFGMGVCATVAIISFWQAFLADDFEVKPKAKTAKAQVIPFRQPPKEQWGKIITVSIDHGKRGVNA